MSNEELMMSRYRVIAAWPKAGIVKVGDIIIADDPFINDLFWVGGDSFTECELKDFPHLFKELGWWEERTIEELPNYIKIITNRMCLYFSNYIFINASKTPAIWRIMVQNG